MLVWSAVFVVIFCGLFHGGDLSIPAEWIDNRIVNGSETSIETTPYQVSVQQFSTKKHFCGGSLITPNIVVSAAHCFQLFRLSDIRVRLGSSHFAQGGELVRVEKILLHENFTRSTMQYDVALLKMATPVRRSSKIQFIELARSLPPTGTELLATGWGVTCHSLCPQSPILLGITLSFIDRETCASKDYGYGDQISESMVCAYTIYEDTCQGDSGGPLVYDNKLVGIVSWGQGCAVVGYPGIYTDVPMVRNWILKNARELNKN